MWPNHCSLLARIHITTSNVFDLDDASSCGVFPVIALIMSEFSPFNSFLTSMVKNHASDPYVSTLHTLDLYRQIFSPWWRSLLYHMWLSLSNRACVIAILVFTSGVWHPDLFILIRKWEFADEIYWGFTETDVFILLTTNSTSLSITDTDIYFQLRWW